MKTSLWCLFILIAETFMVKPAIAQVWRSSVHTDPITDAPVAVAAVNEGGNIYGWDLVVWCGPDDLGMNWNISVQTKEIIDSQFRRQKVAIRFDDHQPLNLDGTIGGDYSNILFLTSGYDEPIERFIELVNEMKKASSLAVRIGVTSKVFSLKGSNTALSRLVRHCDLEELLSDTRGEDSSLDDSSVLVPGRELEGIY